MDAPETPEQKEREQGIGPLAGALIIVILVVMAGVYFFIQESKRFHAAPIQEQFNA
jgi:hypothetical protein